MLIFLSTALSGSVLYAQHIEIFMLKYALYETTKSQNTQHRSTGTKMVLCQYEFGWTITDIFLKFWLYHGDVFGNADTHFVLYQISD